ncbi:MAG: gliding motility-associated C-terminal domain-containing protein, partial [Aurantibacter sp.]
VFFPTAFGERQVVRMPSVPNTIGTGWERKAVITPDETTPNNAPIANDDSYDLNYEPDPVTLTPLVNDSDNEGDTLQILSISQPDHGTAVLNPDGTIAYTPEPGFLGTATLTYVVEDMPSCRIFTMSDSATIRINITEDTPITSSMYDEEVFILCGEEIPEIPALQFMGGCGSFTVEFDEQTDFTDNASDYMIVRTWTVTDICNQVQVFQQTIFIMQRDPAYITLEICTLDAAIDLSDFLPQNFETSGTYTMLSGDATVSSDGVFDPTGLDLGVYIVDYTATTAICSYSVEYTITVHDDCVLMPCDPEDLIVSKTITVNGDGINDFLEINGLEECNFIYQIEVFNRWGKMVYASDDYQNNWGAFSPNNSFGDSGTLPTGTYYYILNFGGETIKSVDGYIYIGTK